MSFIRKRGQGGGFLNGESGVLLDYAIKVNKTGETKKGNKFTTISIDLTVQADGKDPVSQFFDAGFLYGNNTVSKDGKSIAGSDNYVLDADTAWGQFLVSGVEREEGLAIPEELLGDGRNYAALMGTRVVFKRIIDEQATLDRGARKLGTKAKSATREQLIDAGKRQDKKDKDKSYMLDKLLIGEVLALPEAGAKTGAKKATAKAAPKAATKAAPAAADTDDADAAILAILEGTGGTIERGKIQSSVVRYALSKKLGTAERDALRNTLPTDEYLAGAVERGLVAMEGDTVLLAA